jgi:polyisoprenoid-binding protein YceI
MTRVLLVLVLTATAALAQPAQFQIDDTQTELVAIVRPGGLFGGHAHAIKATRVTGTVGYDSTNPQASTVDISFPADGLENDDAALRKKLSLPEFNASDRAAVATNLRGPDQLDVKKHASVRFKTTGATGSGNTLELEGTLSIRGVDTKVRVPVSFEIKDGVLTGTGRFSITHAMFGFKPYSALLGAVRNAEAIDVKVKVVGRTAGPP